MTTFAAGEPTPRDPGEEVSARHRLVQWLLLSLPTLWILAVGWTHRWTAEDGFIYLRIVRQVRVGNGPVFNAGQRVEAFTGPLWVAILSVLDLITPIRLEWIAVFLGLALTGTAVWLAMAGSCRLWPALGDRGFAVPLGAAVFVAVFPVWAFATSGFETSLVFAWIATSFWILSRWASERRARFSRPELAVLGLGWLVRPEMVVFSAGFVLVALASEWHPGGWKQRLRVVAAAVALPVAYQIFRMGYYGSLVANTAIAKEGSRARWSNGWRYLQDFAGPYWLWVPVLGLVAAGYVPLARSLARGRDSRRAIVLAILPICGLANALYVIGVGGDYHHARMLLPAFFAICAPVAVVPATRQHLAGVIVAVWVVVSVVSLRPDQYRNGQFLANGFLAPRGFGEVTRDDIGWGDTGTFLRWYQGPAYYHEGGLLQYIRTDVTTAPGVPLPYGSLWGIGVSGYAVGPGFHVLDLMGLADPFTAHLQNQPSLVAGLPRFPGHEKPLPSPWVAARVTPPGTRPDPTDFPSFGNPLIPPTTGAEFQEQVAWARAALECPDIENLLSSSDAPLTPGRFVHNFVGSFAETRLRIPPDPETAFHRFCGTGTPAEVLALRRQR